MEERVDISLVARFQFKGVGGGPRSVHRESRFCVCHCNTSTVAMREQLGQKA